MKRTLRSSHTSGYLGHFESKGLFNSGLKWSIEAVAEPLSSKICFVYPGQGAMFSGMARGYEASEIFSSFFKRADFILSRTGFPSVSHYAFSPELLTVEASDKIESVALFTFCCALTHELVRAGFRPEVVTGHSFGEYAALVASGIWDFETGLECVLQRERILPERNSAGYMLAVAKPVHELNQALSGIPFYLSNVNSPNQTVISLSWDHLIDAETRLKKTETRHKRLSSPQPFHSPLLNPAAQAMAKFASQQSHSSLRRTDFFSGVLKSWTLGGPGNEKQIERIVSTQLVEPVDFPLQIQSIAKRCQHFIEVGPRPFLLDLIKSNLNSKDFTCSAGLGLIKLNDRQESQRLIRREEVNEGILRRVNTIIAKITGYSFEEIKFEDRFQEDLGIDSIKTMEISIELLNEFQLPRDVLTSVQQVKSVGELAFQVQRQRDKKPVGSEVPLKTTQFQVFKNTWFPSPLNETFLTDFTFAKHSLIVANGRECWSKLKGRNLSTIQFLILFFDKPIELSFKSINLEAFCEWFLGFQKAAGSGLINNSTRIAVISTEPEDPMAQTIASFLFSIKKENAIRFATHIVFDSSYARKEQEQLALKELRLGSDNRVRYQDSKRQVLSLEPVPVSTSGKENKQTFIALGGAKGITFEIVKHLVSQHSYDVHLIGRTPSEDPEVQRNLMELKAFGTQVSYHQADGTDFPELEKAFRLIFEQSTSVSGVLQGAGAESSRSFSEKSQEDIRDEFFAKVQPTINLKTLADQFGIKNQILFSSIIAHFGNLGQSIYSAANNLSENMWYWRAEKGAIVIQWPPWEATGMTKKPVIDQVLRQAGVSLLPKDQAGKFFDSFPVELGKMIFDANDFLLYQGPLVDWGRLGFGEISALPLNSKLQLKLSLSTERFPVLKDHSIEERTLMPIALVGFVFDETRFLLGLSTTTVSQLHMYRPFEVDHHSKNLFLSVSRQEANTNRINLALFDESGLLAEASTGEFTSNRNPQKRNDGQALKKYGPEELYRKERLFHGPHFQFLKRLSIYENKTAKAEIDCQKIRQAGQPTWYVWTGLIDSGLQALAGVGFHFFSGAGLPVAIGEIERLASPSENDELSWEITHVKNEDRKLSADLTLKNQKEEVLAHIYSASFNWK